MTLDAMIAALTHAALPCLSLLMLCGRGGVVGTAGRGRALWQGWTPQDLDPGIKGPPFLWGEFPEGFLWGTGSAAFQTEGAWDQQGRGPSIWDHFTRSRPNGADIDPDTDEASRSYQLWTEDVASLKHLGVRSYVFSLSWPRLFPNGTVKGATPNAEGVAHYSRLLDSLKQEGIEPVVTLYHWDLPLALQERYGGWLNDSLVEIFDDYAAFCFQAFGERVRYWITIHNPYLVAWQGYRTGLHAPGQTGSPTNAFTVAHNLIRAHAKAWHTYDGRFRARQKGHVSIALGTHWMEPLDGQATASNVEQCQESMEAVLGWFAEPIHGGGDYPASLRRRNPGILLPTFTESERQRIRGTADFFAVSFGPNNLRLRQSLARFGQQVSLDLRRALSWVSLEYGDPPVLIVENGWFSDATVGTDDTVAIYLMKKFINQVLQAIVHDSVRVFGYTAWSLVDGFEWNYGYSVRRGLFYVDFKDPQRIRVPKTSAYFYKQVVADNGFPGGLETQTVSGRFPCDFHWGISDSTLQVHFRPFSPQFTDPHLYRWNLTGDGALKPVSGAQVRTRGAQCTDYLAIQKHLRLLEAAGVQHYRFALNWSLILPQGDLSVVNGEALRYYYCMVSELRKRNIGAMVILYYPTPYPPSLGLPASIHGAGGWLNRSTVESFREYARLCFKELGPWVQQWVTVNEPNRLSQTYNASDPYLAAHHLILAHAAAWRLYQNEFREQQGGLVSFSLHADWAEPANPFLESHGAAAKRLLLFELAFFLDPLLEGEGEREGDAGGYPGEVREYLEEKKFLGLSRASVPRFTAAERREVRGALDFIAINHFTTRLVADHRVNSSLGQFPDHDCQLLFDPTWPTSSKEQSLVPWGLRRVLRWLKQRYGDFPVFISANGVDDKAPKEDHVRQYYLKNYLQEALKAYQIDGVNLRGYYIWNLQDRHAPLFGLFTSPQSHSSPKGSVAAYREVIVRGGFPEKGRGTSCEKTGEPTACTLCSTILENKALFFFGLCLVLTFTMLTLMAVVTTRRRRRRRRTGRRLGLQPATGLIRRKRRAWDRAALHLVIDSFHDNCLK